MSDRVEQSFQDGDGSSDRQYQSLWMSHWTSTTAVPQPVNHSNIASKSKLIENGRMQGRLLNGIGVGLEYSRSAKRFREVEVNERVLEKEQHNYHWPQFTSQRNSAFIASSSRNPNPLSAREMIEFQNLERKKPRTVHDVETMRIISQTTHSFLITKKTDVNLVNDSQSFRESRVPTQLAGNRSRAPLFGHRSGGVTIQSLSSSTDSDKVEKIPSFKPFEGRNYNSSTDTDTMDIDSVKKKNHGFGAFTPIPRKVVITDPSESQPKTTSDEEKVRNTNRKTELPDINIELTAPPETTEDSPENKPEPSTSKTQSLDMDILFPSANPSNPEPKQSKSFLLGLDPTNRWLNRLKSTSSEQSDNKLICKTNKGNITLEHPWIQRWRHNRGEGTQKKQKAENLSPRDSKMDIEKKQFPSIAAMALMGKAFTGFQPCEFRKRGSFLVWNTASL